MPVVQVDKDLEGFVAYTSELLESEASTTPRANIETVEALLTIAQRCLHETTDTLRTSIRGIVDQLEVRRAVLNNQDPVQVSFAWQNPCPMLFSGKHGVTPLSSGAAKAMPCASTSRPCHALALHLDSMLAACADGRCVSRRCNEHDAGVIGVPCT